MENIKETTGSLYSVKAGTSGVLVLEHMCLTFIRSLSVSVSDTSKGSAVYKHLKQSVQERNLTESYRVV
jgi:hypothetical protein